MPNGRLVIEEGVSPEQALARGAALYEALRAELPVALYAATLRGEVVVLGSHQREDQALSEAVRRRVPVFRRQSGGASVYAGDGISYLALALHDRATLMACPPQRILNRNVRGALQGLRAAGVSANYFGRDFLSFEARPAVYVGWDAAESGRVLLEFFVCEQRGCWLSQGELGYPPRAEDPLRGRQPTTLVEAGAKVLGAQLLEKFADGYGAGFKVEWQRSEAPLTAAGTAAPEAGFERLLWSFPREEAIGFVSAGVLLDGAGKLAAVRVAGDFFAHRACQRTLERMLLGVAPQADLVGRAVDGAYAQSAHDVEGIRNLRVLQESILDAAALAAGEAPNEAVT